MAILLKKGGGRAQQSRLARLFTSTCADAHFLTGEKALSPEPEAGGEESGEGRPEFTLEGSDGQVRKWIVKTNRPNLAGDSFRRVSTGNFIVSTRKPGQGFSGAMTADAAESKKTPKE